MHPYHSLSFSSLSSIFLGCSYFRLINCVWLWNGFIKLRLVPLSAIYLPTARTSPPVLFLDSFICYRLSLAILSFAGIIIYMIPDVRMGDWLLGSIIPSLSMMASWMDSDFWDWLLCFGWIMLYSNSIASIWTLLYSKLTSTSNPLVWIKAISYILALIEASLYCPKYSFDWSIMALACHRLPFLETPLNSDPRCIILSPRLYFFFRACWIIISWMF